MATKAYCVKCKKKDQPMVGEKLIWFKVKSGKRPAMQGTCPDCGTKMTRILSKEQAEQAEKAEKAK